MSLSAENNKAEEDENPTAVTSFEVTPSRLIHYTCKILEPPFSTPVQLVQSGNGMVSTQVLNATGKKNSSYLGFGGLHGETSATYKDILSKSRTFVMNDSWLTKTDFQRHGLTQLVKFFNRGGTVVVIHHEGIQVDILNKAFGCQWRPHSHVSSYHCVATDASIALLGRDRDGRSVLPPEVFVGKAQMMHVPDGEALYVPVAYPSKRLFLEKRHGLFIDDEDWDAEKDVVKFDRVEEEIDWLEEVYWPALQEWEMYNPPTYTPVAVHRGGKRGGHVVWIGDKMEDDTRMRSVIAQLLTADLNAFRDDHHDDEFVAFSMLRN